jgi:hypothetical protein
VRVDLDSDRLAATRRVTPDLVDRERRLAFNDVLIAVIGD